MCSDVPEVEFTSEFQQHQDDNGSKLTAAGGRRVRARRLLWRVFLGSAALSCVTMGLYMTTFYIRSMILLRLDAWDLVNPGMYHQDRPDSNVLFALHLIGGAYLMLCGPLQFVPAIRRNFMTFHRWNGRLSIASSMLAAMGGIYYTFAVGATATPLIGQTVNWSNVGFGLAFVLCGGQTYRHAAWTKRIDQHKLWAYRLAGICFGNVFARIYLLFLFMFLGEEDPNMFVLKAAILFLEFVFYLPFILLAGEIWKNEQKEESTPSVVFLVFATLLLALFVVGYILVALFTWMPFMGISLDQEAQAEAPS